MKLKEYQIELQDLVKETVTLLCKNALPVRVKRFSLDALICVTPDNASAFVLKLEETVGCISAADDDHDANDANDSLDDSSDVNDIVDEADANDVHQCDNNVKTEPESIDCDKISSTDTDNDDDTNKMDESAAQQDGDLVVVKQEPPDDGPFAPADKSSADDTVLDVSNVDDGCHDGSSSLNQSPSTDGQGASGSRQVRDFATADRVSSLKASSYR